MGARVLGLLAHACMRHALMAEAPTETRLGESRGRGKQRPYKNGVGRSAAFVAYMLYPAMRHRLESLCHRDACARASMILGRLVRCAPSYQQCPIRRSIAAGARAGRTAKARRRFFLAIARRTRR